MNESPDTLRSKAIMSLVDLIGEGKIGGLVNGCQSVFLNDTPLQNPDGSFNFNSVTVDASCVGTPTQAPLQSMSDIETPSSFGGSAVKVRKDTPKTFTITNADADQVRIVMYVPALMTTNSDNGDVYGSKVQYKFQIASKVNGSYGAYQDINADLTYGGDNSGTSGMEGGYLTAYAPGGALGLSALVVARGPVADYEAGGTTGHITAQAQYWNGSAWVNLGATFDLIPTTLTLRQVNRGLGTSGAFGARVEFPWREAYASKIRFVVAAKVQTTDYSGSPVGDITLECLNIKSIVATPVVTMEGKVKGKYQRQHLLTLPKPASEWTIRINRLTDDDPPVTVQNELYAESYTEITNLKLNYPNSAVFAVSVDSSTLSSIPRRSYLVDGLLISVPSNRVVNADGSVTYSGVWDGTFKANKEVCDNPAWVLYDLLTNSRYGLGQFVTPGLVDKAKLYEIGKYCDGLVSNGVGGWERRFTVNTVINEAKEAYELIVELCAVFRGMAFWNGGMVCFTQDAPRDAGMVYGNANVIDGLFTYSGTARKDRHTVALITWNDPNQNYRQAVEYVEESTLVAKYGIRKLEMNAFGCTSRAMAVRIGRWALYTERDESDVISFKVGLDSALVLPGEVISINDQYRAGKRMAGRVVSATTTSATLDAPVTLSAANASVSMRLPDGTFATRTVTNGAGTFTTLNWSSALAATPLPNAMFIVAEAAGGLQPLMARVIGIGQDEENSSNLVISALEHNPGKFDAIENGLALQVPETSVIDSTAVMAPIEFAATQSTYQAANGVAGIRVTLTWQGNCSSYEVQWRRAGSSDNWNVITTSSLSVDIDGVSADQYEFRITGVSALGRRSVTSTLAYTVVGSGLAPADVTGLAVAVQDAGIRITWNACTSPSFVQTRLRVGASWSAGEPIYGGRETACLWPFQQVGSYTVRAKHEALGSVLSVNEATASVTILAPGSVTPTGVVQTPGIATLSWTGTGKTTQPISYYEVRLGASGSSAGSAADAGRASAGSTSWPINIASNGAKRIFIRPVDAAGNVGTWAQYDFTATTGLTADTTPAAALASFTATTGFASVWLTWTEPNYTNGGGHGAVNVYRADWSSGPTQPAWSSAVRVGTVQRGTNNFIDPIGVSKKAVYWLKNETINGVEQTNPTGTTVAANAAGVLVQTTTIGNTDLGPLVVEASNLANGAVGATQLAAQAIDATKFANSIDPVGVVSALPTAIFTRASTATYVDAGLVKTAAANEPRWQGGVLLLEAAKTNLLLRSSTFNTGWGTFGTLTVAPDATVAPDGTLTADKLTSGSADAGIFQGVSGLTAGSTYTGSVWLRADTPCQIGIFITETTGGSGNTQVVVNVTTQWQRFSVTRVLGASVTGASFQIGGASSFTTGEAVYAWGAQLELGSLSSLIPTTTAQVTRAADVDGYKTPRTVLLTTDGKLYRLNYATASFVSNIEAGDLSGQIGNSQIGPGAVNDASLAAGAVKAEKLAIRKHVIS
jgi:predicted phage tail protein